MKSSDMTGIYVTNCVIYVTNCVVYVTNCASMRLGA